VAGEAPAIAGEALRRSATIVAVATAVEGQLARLSAPTVRASVDDANAHLGRLVRPGFVLHAGIDRLPDVGRYVRSIAHRLDHLAGAADGDRRRMAEVVPLEERYRSFVDRLEPGAATPAIVDVGWRLEELRVSVFAQSIGARGPVSAKRVAAALAAIGA
jgi:ATP-dependent helicase HrpA